MPNETINGTSIYLEEHGSGDPLVLVHGSWVDHMDWVFAVPLLASRFRVVAYDRRGHSQSDRPDAQGSIHEDVADLAAIIERAGTPAHVVANSFGGSIALRLACERPDLVRTLSAHEPPLIDLLWDDPETAATVESISGQFGSVAEQIATGEMEAGARAFVGLVLGPEAWDQFVPDPVKQTLVQNAPTFLDEARDPDATSIDVAALGRVSRPLLLTGGTESPPLFALVLRKLESILPHATRKTFAGAGHLPHLTHAQEYVSAITEFISASEA